MSDYGTRKCLTCGKEFEPSRYSQICCSKDCQNNRRKKLHNVNQVKYRLQAKEFLAKTKSRIEYLELKIIHISAINSDLAKEIEEMKAKKAKNGIHEAASAPIAPKPEFELKKCLRCDMKALHLPCGQNALCWHVEPCEKCAHMTRPRNDLLGGLMTAGE